MPDEKYIIEVVKWIFKGGRFGYFARTKLYLYEISSLEYEDLKKRIKKK